MIAIVLALLAQILHLGLMIVAAPTVDGAMEWLHARLCGSAGPPVLLPWRDLVRLARKTPMTIESTSPVSRLAPAAGLGAVLLAVALVPSFTLGMALSPLADVLVIVSLLTLERFANSLGALDSGAAMPGLAAQGASAHAILAEPALMLAVVALALTAGSFNLDLIIGEQREGLLLPTAASAIVLMVMLALLFAEASPARAELDQMLSGIGLAMANLTLWLRRLVWFNLIGALFLPIGIATADDGPVAWLIGLGFWGIKSVGFILGLSLLRIGFGSIPRNRLPDLTAAAAVLVLLATIMVLASSGAA